MNNVNAAQLVTECKTELESIKAIIEQYGSFSSIVPYLTNYSVVKACGTIEQSYKTIIADCCEKGQNQQVRTYIHNTFRDSSRNPSYENICKSLADFDTNWNTLFKKTLGKKKNATKLRTSLKSLNEARNAFAHGGKPNVSFSSVIDYFKDSLVIITILDSVVA